MKIGIMNYFATGEGFTLFIMSGTTEQEILVRTDKYWHVGFDFFDAKELKEYLNSGKNDNDEFEMTKNLLKSHVPIFYKHLIDSGCATVDYQLHYNLG